MVELRVAWLVDDVTKLLILTTTSYRAPRGGNTALIKATDPLT